MSTWIATAVGKMHIHKVHQKALAAHMGVTEEYISMIFNGKRSPKNAEQRIMTAIDELIAERG